jgi:acetyltransferase-like isoleucine patch superfamily enzyme
MLESGVMIAAGVIFTNDRYPRACDPDTSALVRSALNEDTVHIVVRAGATIGAGTVIGPGIQIGRYAMIGMGSVVAGHVPPHALVFGNPARLRGYVCVCGVPLVDWSEHDEPVHCRRCGRAFDVSAEGSELHLNAGRMA